MNYGKAFVHSPISDGVLKIKIAFDDDSIVQNVDFKIFGERDWNEKAKDVKNILVGLTIEDLMELYPEDLNDDSVLGLLLLDGITTAVGDIAEQMLLEDE